MGGSRDELTILDVHSIEEKLWGLHLPWFTIFQEDYLEEMSRKVKREWIGYLLESALDNNLSAFITGEESSVEGTALWISLCHYSVNYKRASSPLSSNFPSLSLSLTSRSTQFLFMTAFISAWQTNVFLSCREKRLMFLFSRERSRMKLKRSV